MRKGDKAEQDISFRFHQGFTPVLVSSLILRSVHAGQIDVAYLFKINGRWLLHLCEVKFKTMPSKVQIQRLLRSQDYLSRVLAMETKLEVKFCQKEQPSLFF